MVHAAPAELPRFRQPTGDILMSSKPTPRKQGTSGNPDRVQQDARLMFFIPVAIIAAFLLGDALLPEGLFSVSNWFGQAEIILTMVLSGLIWSLPVLLYVLFFE